MRPAVLVDNTWLACLGAFAHSARRLELIGLLFRSVSAAQSEEAPTLGGPRTNIQMERAKRAPLTGSDENSAEMINGCAGRNTFRTANVQTYTHSIVCMRDAHMLIYSANAR